MLDLILGIQQASHTWLLCIDRAFAVFPVPCREFVACSALGRGVCRRLGWIEYLLLVRIATT